MPSRKFSARRNKSLLSVSFLHALYDILAYNSVIHLRVMNIHPAHCILILFFGSVSFLSIDALTVHFHQNMGRSIIILVQRAWLLALLNMPKGWQLGSMEGALFLLSALEPLSLP